VPTSGMVALTAGLSSRAPDLPLGRQRRLKLRTNVEVVRRGLRLLAETTERQALKEAYRKASMESRSATVTEIEAFDPLAPEGLD
jgi:hypothetical protein